MKLVITIILLIQTAVCCGQDDQVITPEQMIKWIPAEFEGYRVVNENKGRMLKIGTLTYSMVERSYVNHKRKITMLLFDYNRAPIMYHQATSKWSTQSPVETDSIVNTPLTWDENSGWQSYHKLNNASQLSLGIHKRFYLILNGSDVTIDVLKSLLSSMTLSEFPNQNFDVTAPKTR